MSFKQQAASGVKWTGLSMAVATLLQFLQLAVLARLLDPQDFGMMAMIMVVVGFSWSFADLGIGNAIIHRQDVTRDQLSTLYWLNMLTGAAVFILLRIVTPLVVALYSEARLTDLMSWVTLIFLITPIGQQFQILLQKNLQFSRLAKVEVAAVAVGTVVAISSGLAGQGVFSLVWGQLASATTKALLLATLGWRIWRPALRFRRDDLKGYVGFGVYQIGEKSVNYLSANVDYLMIGRFLGPEILGAYTLAYQLVIVPLSKINPMMTRVAFPVFAMKQTDHAALRRGYLELIRLLALAVFPALVGLGITAPLLVPLVFGEGWAPTIPLVRILAPLGMLKALGNPSGSLLLAKGRADIGFMWNLVVAIINTSVLGFAAQFSVYVVAWSYATLCVVYFVFELMILRSVIGFGVRDYLAVLIRPTVMSTVMGAVVLTSYHILLSRPSIGRLPLMLSLCSLGILVYGLLVVMVERRFLAEIWRLVAKNRQEAGQCQGL